MGKPARSLVALYLSVLFISSCALTLKQDFLGMKRDWLALRAQVLVLADQKKLTPSIVQEFVKADIAFSVTYTKTVDKLLSGGDVTEDEVIFLKGMIAAWKVKVGL